MMSCFTKLVKKVTGFPQHISQLYILLFYINAVTDKSVQKIHGNVQVISLWRSGMWHIFLQNYPHPNVNGRL